MKCIIGIEFSKECVEDIIIKGFLKDITKQFSSVQSTLNVMAGHSNKLVTGFLNSVGCAKDPSVEIRKALNTCITILETLFDWYKSPEVSSVLGNAIYYIGQLQSASDIMHQDEYTSI